MLWATTSTVSTGWPLVYFNPERKVAKAAARSSMVAVEGKTARVEEQADLAIALEHLIGDAERAGKRGRDSPQTGIR